MSISDIEALKYWQSLPDDIRALLLVNVFCRNCGTTKVVNYALVKRGELVVVEGECASCGHGVARVIND